jgi:hypothetical protein
MQVLHTHRTRSFFASTERTWPLEARAATFVLEAAGTHINSLERRGLPRPPCRVVATLCASDEPASLGQTIIYTRDVDETHLGFICHSELPQEQMLLHLSLDEIGSLRIPGRIVRCRRFMEGWYEGVLRFDAPQPLLGG